MKKNNLVLIFGQLTMFVGFMLFLFNYFLFNSNLFVVFSTIIIFSISMMLNLTYLIIKRNQNDKG